MAKYPKYNQEDPKPYWGQILQDAPQGLNGEEWLKARQILEKELKQDLITNGICPECATKLSGVDPVECEGCGMIATTTGIS